MNHTKGLSVITIIFILLCCFTSVDAGPAVIEKADIDKALSGIKDYENQMDCKSLLVVENIVQQTYKQAELRKYIEQRFIELLESEASIAAKQFVCRQLWVIGSFESVPVLRKMLADKQTAQMACFALRENPSPQAAKALREALKKSQGQVLVAIINLLGQRGDAQSIEAMSKLALGEDSAVAVAAVSAMGKIGGSHAAKVLAEVRKKPNPKIHLAATNAYLQCAEGLLAQGKKQQASAIYRELNNSSEAGFVRAAAVRGLVDTADTVPKKISLVLSALGDNNPLIRRAVIQCIRTIHSKELAERLAKQLPFMPADVQVSLIYTFVDLNDLSARPAITVAAGSKNTKVKTAALKALGKIGDTSSVKPLVQVVAESTDVQEKNAALGSLRLLNDDGVDTAIVESMKNSPPGIRPELIQVVVDRNVVGAVPDLLNEAGSPDENVSKAAFKALGRLAGEKDLPLLVRLLVNLKSDNARKEAERAVVMVSRRVGNKNRQADIILKAMQTENRIPVKCSLLRVLGGIANEKAFESLRAALKESSFQVQAEAVRAIAGWPNERALDVLMDILQNTNNEKHRVLALRGCVRLLTLPGTRQPQETLKMYRVAMNYAHRPDESKLILAGLANVSEPEALEMAQQYLNNKAVRAEAALAAVKIAGNIAGSHRRQVKTVMKKVIAVSQDADLRKKAEQVILKIENIEDFNKIEPAAIFDGRTFTGWEENSDMFRIEDGALVGGTLQKNIPHSEYLCTTKQYGDFELRLKAKLAGQCHNGGIQFRSRRVPGSHTMVGYQADMGIHQGKNIWGSLYDEGRRDGFVATSNQEELAEVFKPGDWNEYVIRCLGERIQLWVNGYKTVDYTETDDTIEQKGVIGLQIHAGPPGEALYKDIVIKEIGVGQ